MKEMEMEFKSPACPEFEVFLEDYIAGELTSNDATKVSEHLQSCAGCRSALDGAAASVRLLRVAEPSADLGPGFARVVMARIRADVDRLAGEKSIWQPFVSLAWRFAATATLALAVLLSYDASLHGQPQQNLALAVSQAESHDLFPDPGGAPENRDQVLMMVAETNHGKH
jgi:anti-sigma factor RsiW